MSLVLVPVDSVIRLKGYVLPLVKHSENRSWFSKIQKVIIIAQKYSMPIVRFIKFIENIQHTAYIFSNLCFRFLLCQESLNLVLYDAPVIVDVLLRSVRIVYHYPDDRVILINCRSHVPFFGVLDARRELLGQLVLVLPSPKVKAHQAERHGGKHLKVGTGLDEAFKVLCQIMARLDALCDLFDTIVFKDVVELDGVVLPVQPDLPVFVVNRLALIRIFVLVEAEVTRQAEGAGELFFISHIQQGATSTHEQRLREIYRYRVCKFNTSLSISERWVDPC